MKAKNDILPHVGKMLKDFYKDKKITMTAIGRAMGLEGSTIIYHYKQPELNMGILLKYSLFFKHNFFMDIASHLPKDFTTNAPLDEEKIALIATLQEELKTVKDDLKIIKAERDLLKEIIGNRM